MDLMLPATIDPFHTSAKRRGVARKLTEPRRALVSVQPAGHRHARSIIVLAPDRMYLVGRDHIVTRNGTSSSTLRTTSANTQRCW